MKKVCSIVHVISSLKIGGAESWLVNVVTALKKRGYQQHVIYFHPGPNLVKIQALGVPTYEIKGSFFRYDIFFFWRLLKILIAVRADVIHSSLWMANFATRFVGLVLGKRIISSIHSVVGRPEDGRIRNMIDTYTLRLTGCTVAVADEVARTLKESAWVPPNTLKTIKNGIDIEAANRAMQQHSLSRTDIQVAATDFVIGAVGRFIPSKNYLFLLRVFARFSATYSDAQLLLIGGGPEEMALRNYCALVGISKRVLFVIGQSAFGYYKMLDLYVSTSVREGLSIALLEAMAAELPCIVGSPTIQHEVIQHGTNGFVFRENNEDELYSLFERMYADKDLGKKVGGQARLSVEKDYTVDTMIAQYEQIYQDLASKSPRIKDLLNNR